MIEVIWYRPHPISTFAWPEGLANLCLHSNDRLGKKVRVKCDPDDTIGDFKKLVAAQIGTSAEKAHPLPRELPPAFLVCMLTE